MTSRDDTVELVLYQCLAALARFMEDDPGELVVCLEHVYSGEYGVAYDAICAILASKPVDDHWSRWVLGALAPLEYLRAGPSTSGGHTAAFPRDCEPGEFLDT